MMCTYNYHRSIVEGFSTRDLKEASHCAPTAPSTTLWSQLRVTVIMLAIQYLGGRGGKGGRPGGKVTPKINTLTNDLKKPTLLFSLVPTARREREREREMVLL